MVLPIHSTIEGLLLPTDVESKPFQSLPPKSQMHSITPGLKTDMSLRRHVTTKPRLEIDLNLCRDIVPPLVVRHSKTSSWLHFCKYQLR